METGSLVVLLPELDLFLGKFNDCVLRSAQRQSLRCYVNGQLSDLPRKSIEPMALAAPPRFAATQPAVVSFAASLGPCRDG